MSNLTDVYMDNLYPLANATMIEIYNKLTEFDIEDFEMSWRSSFIDISIVEDIRKIEEIIYYINDELISNIYDQKCRTDIINLNTLLLSLGEVSQFRFREHNEIETALGYIISAYDGSDNENDRLSECLDNNIDKIEQLVCTYKDLISYLEV